jgi:lipopolysaccharide transport system ATP-binding protein
LQRLIGQNARQYYREFWALKDIAFEVKKGETLGIIGRNGAGKSTLLQILCGTLTPTSGNVEIAGRVAALLELGAGFNPEFTGRENVYMNATVLGLTRDEIDARYDDIAAFADIGAFIEQPVKTYSSGMYVRLAFSVIAHVDADILIVDEALSVGDAVFSQKCMRFIRSFQERGTLLFVSHDTSSVQNLCKTAIWLGHGQIQKMGSSKQVVEAYQQFTLQEIYGDEARLRSVSSTTERADSYSPSLDLPVTDPTPVAYNSQLKVRDNLVNATGWNTGAAEIVSVSCEKLGTDQAAVLEGGERVRIVVRVRANKVLGNPIVGFLVRDRLGQNLFGENTLAPGVISIESVEAGSELTGEFVFRLPMLPNGEYAVAASVADGDLYNNVQHHWLHDALIFKVYSSTVRWGLVGVEFERVDMKVCT